MKTIPGEESERLQVRGLVAGGVCFRFAMGADQFAARVWDIVRARVPDGPGPAEWARRLSLDDLYVAVSCANGEDCAWAELLAAHGDFIRRFARRILREPAAGDTADQVIADLWLRKKITRYEGWSSLRTWLGAIVAHAAINARKSARRRERGADAAAHLFRPDARRDTDAERAAQVATLVASAIARQSVDDRLLLLRYYEEGMTLEDIGAVMLRSKAALSRRLKRIRDAILDDAESEAWRRVGRPARSLVEGLALSDIDLDLRVACGPRAVWAPTHSDYRWRQSA